MQLLNTLLRYTEEEVQEFMQGFLSEQYDNIINKKGEYTYCKGSGNMMLVAHMDTVRDETTELYLNTDRGCLYNVGGILGADDRAGVYAIYRLIEDGHRPSILLTQGEESGGIGVKKFIEDKIDLSHVNLMIEIDREGCNQYVTYQELPTEVTKYVESFGWEEHRGLYSDIADLTRHYNIPSVNVSAGYHDQHTVHERLYMDELEMTISKVDRMLYNPIDKLYVTDFTVPYLKDALQNEKDMLGEYFTVPFLEDVLQDEFIIDNNQDCLECGMNYLSCSCGSVANEIIWYDSSDIEYYTSSDYYESKLYEEVTSKYLNDVDLY